MIRCGDCDYFGMGECCWKPPEVVINAVNGMLLWVRPPVNSDQGCGQGKLRHSEGIENDD